MFKKEVKRTLIVVFAAVIIFSIVQARTEKTEHQEAIELQGGFISNINELRKISDIMDLISGYADVEKEIDKDMLVQGAIKGMLKELEDPYSGYLKSEIMDSFEEDLKGEYAGVGMVVTKRDDYLAVVSPIEGTPSDKAGMRPNDKIIGIEEESTFDLSLAECVERLKGEPNTDVTITVYRESTEETFEVTLTRAIIKIKYVRSEMLDDEIGYLRLTHFGATVSEDIRKAIDELKEQGMKALIFDIRNNPGGELTSAIEVASVFVEKSPIVSVKYKAGGQENEELPSLGEAYTDFPLIVLTNQGSASASEIVAGAIKDHDRGITVGEKTFGKGSVQSVFPLHSDEGAIKLTVARYYRPSGISVHGEGIEPDIRVAEDDAARFFEGFVMNVVEDDENVEKEDEEKIEFIVEDKELEKEEIPDHQLEAGINVLKGILLYETKN